MELYLFLCTWRMWPTWLFVSESVNDQFCQIGVTRVLWTLDSTFWTYPGPDTAFDGDRAAMVDDLEQALYASKIVSYAQGYQYTAWHTNARDRLGSGLLRWLSLRTSGGRLSLVDGIPT